MAKYTRVIRDHVDAAMFLREIRARQGVRQSELAKRLGLSQGRVSQIETGRHSPRWETIVAWADALGLELELTMRERDAAYEQIVALHAER